MMPDHTHNADTAIAAAAVDPTGGLANVIEQQAHQTVIAIYVLLAIMLVTVVSMLAMGIRQRFVLLATLVFIAMIGLVATHPI